MTTKPRSGRRRKLADHRVADRYRAEILTRPNGLKHLAPEPAWAFLNLVRSGDALVRALDAELKAAHGLSLHAFEVLLFLAVFAPEGRLGVSKLVEQAPLSQSRVSRLVAELESQGLVQRSTAPDDCRCVDVAITEQGVQKFREAQETHLRGLHERFFSRLTRDDVADLGRITAKILAEDGG